MQVTYRPGPRVLMIATLIAFIAVTLLLTHQEAQAQVQRVLLRVPGTDPDATYRLAFSLMLLYLLLCTLPLLMIVAYRGLNADSLHAKIQETLAMCDLNVDQIQQRLAQYEQRNSIAAFSLPALVNLMLLYVLWLIDVRLVTTFVLGMLLMGLASAAPGDNVGLGPWLAALAFMIGIVPDLFLRWIGQQLRRVGGIDTEQDGRLFGPSDLQRKIDGMSFWQVGRLAEEGIESVHDLATKELPTLIIQTRFDPALLLDWVDRALLCEQTGADLAVFRQAHVYAATDLIALVGSGAEAAAGVERLLRSFEDAAAPAPGAAGRGDPGDPARPRISAAILANIVQGLGHGPNLRHLAAYRANARTGGAPSLTAPIAASAPGPAPERAAGPPTASPRPTDSHLPNPVETGTDSPPGDLGSPLDHLPSAPGGPCRDRL